MHHAHRLDGMRPVGAQAGFDHVGLHAMAPALDARQPQEFRRQPERLRHLLPQRGEMTRLEHQHRVARAQRVGQRGFPGAGAGGRIDDDRLHGLEDLLDVRQHLAAQRAEFRAAMVDGRVAHGTQDPVRHGARAGDLQKVAASGMEVEFDHWLCLLCELCILHSKYFNRRNPRLQALFWPERWVFTPKLGAC